MSILISRRGVLGGSAAAAASMLVTACATPARPSAAVIAALAPTGRLRASINLGNPVLARRDAATGQLEGVSVDLARAFAAELGVAVDLASVDGAAKSVEAVRSERADIGFFAIDPLRGEGLRFTAPYVLIEGAYLVRKGSAFTDNAQVDRPGVRIMVAKGSAYDLYLTRALKAAALMHVATSPRVVDEFLAQGADVAAGVKQQLEADAARLHDVRLLPGRFMVIEQAMALPATRGAAAQAVLASFVESAKASGRVARALSKHGIEGAIVAPAA